MQNDNPIPDDLHGKRLAMIATVYEEGTSETSVFTGIAHWTGEQLLLRTISICRNSESTASRALI